MIGAIVEDLEREVVAGLDRDLVVAPAVELPAAQKIGAETTAPWRARRSRRAPQQEGVLSLGGDGVRHREIGPLVTLLRRTAGERQDEDDARDSALARRTIRPTNQPFSEGDLPG